MAEREEEAGGDRPLVLLHELANDIVYCRDVIGVHRVPDAEDIGEEGGAKQRRAIREEKPGPAPAKNVGGGQKDIDRRRFPAVSPRQVVEEMQGGLE